VGTTVVAAVLLGYIVAVLAGQRAVLFPHPEPPAGRTRPPDAEQLWLATDLGRIEAWYLPPKRSAERAPVLIYFHGNGELIDFLPLEFAEPRDWGVAVLLVEFPGYGRSTGSPSQASDTAAGLAAFDWATRQPRIDPARVIAYGRSLGGGAAVIVASRCKPAALILESTFTSVRSFAHRFLVPEFLVRDPFDSLSVLGTYAGPTLLFHGDRDEVVPLAQGQRLAQEARSGQLHVLSCGHNDCPKQWPLIRGFLAANAVLPP
jgi:fermentation-respiration switch protein FrsA (DUF1100 family)